jgi:hypothetical protein
MKATAKERGHDFHKDFHVLWKSKKMPETAWETRQSSTFVFSFQPAKATPWNTVIDGLLHAMLQSLLFREHHGKCRRELTNLTTDIAPKRMGSARA